MDTVESSTEAQAAPETVYDGFISYSHAADDLLAPRLQAGLQRFAKPWWKRRALRIFRDESSLSANPHLWSSITDALDQSGWFVLLLSPDAAASPWVNNEVEYWLEHKDPERIIPVLTDGEFGWADGDVTGNAVPEALQGVFADEPRWVDLRFARDEDQLDLQDPRFADAVADIAAAIREVPKDELASEDVRQHRRTRRTAIGAGIVLIALAIAAGGAALLANAQRIEADEQRTAAEEQSNRADNEAESARQAAADAQRSADLARSGELAAAAASSLDADPELASLLAILSIQRLPEGAAPSVESIRSLRRADQANRLRLRHSTGVGPSRQRVDVTPDGSAAIYLNTVEDVVASVDIETGDQLWRRSFTNEAYSPIELAVSPDGSIVAVLVWELGATFHQVQILSVDSGETLTTLPQPCPSADENFWQRNPFSPDGSVLAFPTGTADCGTDPDAGWVTFVDTTSWAEVDRLQLPGAFELMSFAQQADRVVVWDFTGNRVEVRSYPDLEVVQTFDGGGWGGISPAGDRVALTGDASDRFAIYEVDTGEFMGYAEGHDPFSYLATFSPDGETLAVLTRRHDVLVDAHNGTLRSEFGAVELTQDGAFTRDGAALVTVDQNRGTLLVWELGQAGERGTPIGIGALVAGWINPDRIIDGPRAAVHALALGSDRYLGSLHLIDEHTGEAVQSIEAANAAQLPDGRFVIADQEATVRPEDGQPDTLGGGLSIWDPATGKLTPITQCRVLLSVVDGSPAEPPMCADGEPPFGVRDYGEWWILTSPDGSKIAAASSVLVDGRRLIRIWDTDTLDIVNTIEVDPRLDLLALGDAWIALVHEEDWGPTVYSIADGRELAALGPPYDNGPIAASRAHAKAIDDSRFLVANMADQVVILDTAEWTEAARWQAHDGIIRGVSPSPDDTRLATTGEDGTVRIWDLSGLLSGEGPDLLEAPPLVDEIPTEVVSDVRWISDDLLGLAIRSGSWAKVTLDANELVAAVSARLTRSFTDRECQTYGIDPCPTLEDIRNR